MRVGDDARHAFIEARADEMVEQPRPVTLPDEVCLADELVDAERPPGLVAIGVIRFEKRIIGLQIGGRPAVDRNEIGTDRPAGEMGRDLRNGDRRRVPPRRDMLRRQPGGDQGKIVLRSGRKA